MKIEMKGKESELKEYFNNKSKTSKIFKVSEWSPQQRYFLIAGIIFFALIAIIAFGITSLIDSYNHKNYLTTTECYSQINSYLDYQDLPWYKIILLNISPWMNLIAVGLMVGWIFHGVGFKIIGT